MGAGPFLGQARHAASCTGYRAKGTAREPEESVPRAHDSWPKPPARSCLLRCSARTPSAQTQLSIPRRCESLGPKRSAPWSSEQAGWARPWCKQADQKKGSIPHRRARALGPAACRLRAPDEVPARDASTRTHWRGAVVKLGAGRRASIRRRRLLCLAGRYSTVIG